MFWPDSPSSMAWATAADVVTGTKRGLAGHVSFPKADCASSTVAATVSFDPESIELAPSPSSLTQNMKDHTDLIK